MRLLISLIEAKYPASKEKVRPMVWDFHDRNRILDLILLYGNGEILELRAVGENEDVIGALRGVVIGTGGSKKIEIALEEKQSLWLYREGDECYQQPMSNGGYTFIDPTPQPDKFSNQIE